MAETITADYLVVGAGAMGMAFVDTLLSDTQATIVMVDRYARPGGHWTIAYPFVRLHQPSAFYGVNSRPLGEDKVDQVGWNKGLAELATVDEVCGYFSIVMHQTFLPSGRVSQPCYWMDRKIHWTMPSTTL
jgi:cation diffusion facilitator CzcD-associated flavoprotein CzcO